MSNKKPKAPTKTANPVRKLDLGVLQANMETAADRLRSARADKVAADQAFEVAVQAYNDAGEAMEAGIEELKQATAVPSLM